MIYSIAVDSSVGLRKDVYYFRYKDIDFKYVTHKNNLETDDLVCKIPPGSSQADAYALMTEFLSAFAFANDAKIIAYSGIVSQVDKKLNEVNIRYSARRSAYPYELMEEFCYISILKTPTQIQLARLYREAFCSNNIYMNILFFWHCLVYPEVDESAAVQFINKVANSLPRDLDHLEDCLKRFNANKIFMNTDNLKEVSTGEYIKNSIRHSIAHIVRKPGLGVDLQLDSFEQIQHLNDVCMFLHGVARHRLVSEYEMEGANDTSIFKYIKESELS